MSVIRYELPLYCPVRVKGNDNTPGVIEQIEVTCSDCILLLANKKTVDHTKIEAMLKSLGWLSIHQLCAETRLVEA